MGPTMAGSDRFGSMRCQRLARNGGLVVAPAPATKHKWSYRCVFADVRNDSLEGEPSADASAIDKAVPRLPKPAPSSSDRVLVEAPAGHATHQPVDPLARNGSRCT
jgi:hypothetical protein